MNRAIRVAIVQEGAEPLNLEASMQKMERLIRTAAPSGVQLMVFGETWLTGYPAWLDFSPNAARWNHPPVKKVFARMVTNSISVPGPETERIASWAREFGMVVVLGINERVRSGPGNGTLYNSILIFCEDGRIGLHHRKLIPTYNERLVYGYGDGNGLHAVETGLGRITALVCWEHWMPLTRQVLHDHGELIHVALWPSVHDAHQLASRHYAFEGRCFVIATGQVVQRNQLPVELTYPEDWNREPETPVLIGGSAIIGPDGQYLLDPQWNRADMITYTIENLERVIEERMTLDTTGHYSRPDIFTLAVNRARPS